LSVRFPPGHRDLLGVDDDDEVPGVDVRGVLGLPLAAERVGDLGREPAEGQAGRVHDEPVALAVGGLGDVGLHGVQAPRDSRSGEGG
jgi:hypothetical protein